MPKKSPKTIASIRETDLYPPVRDYLVKHGYTVRGEVLGCDITAAKDDALIVVDGCGTRCASKLATGVGAKPMQKVLVSKLVKASGVNRPGFSGGSVL